MPLTRGTETDNAARGSAQVQQAIGDGLLRIGAQINESSEGAIEIAELRRRTIDVYNMTSHYTVAC
jgi:hypothetical protein